MRRLETRTLLICLALLVASIASVSFAAELPAEENAIRPGAGLYVKLPDHWVSLGKESENKPPKQAAGPQPLMVLAKYDASHPGLNPKIRVFYQPIPEDSRKLTPKELLQLAIPRADRASAQPKLETAVREITVAGLPAADASWLYTLPSTNGPTLLRARMVLVRQGDHFFTFGMLSPSEGPDDARPEFQKLLDTLKIQEVPK